MKKKAIKLLSETKKLVTVGKSNKCDKSKCHKAEIKQNRVYPRKLYCIKCLKDIKYEEEILWYKKED